MSATYKTSHYQRIQNVQQYHFWFQSRNALLEQLIRRYIRIPLGKTFLEVGCGTGIVLRLLEHMGFQTTGLDVNSKALEYVKAHTKAVRIRKSFLTYTSKKRYDALGAFDVMEHMNNDVRFLKNTHTVLKKGGYVFLTVPAGMWLWSVVDEASGHKRRYSKRELTKKLVDAGFVVEYVSHWNMLPLPFYFGWKHVASKRKDIIQQYVKVPHTITNVLFSLLLSIESWVLLRVSLPFGATLVAVARKK